jgi:glycosyltransferase involved in cell wall biosynthesis
MLQGGKRTLGIAPVVREEHGPLVSVVTVVYNGAATLQRTIQSVMAQENCNIEYVVVDGGSTDGTLDVLRAYQEHIDLWTSAPDGGIYDAMNKGIALCTGEWVALLNADDQYEAGAVHKAMLAANGRPGTNVVHGDIWIHYPNGQRKLKRPKRSGFLLKYWEMVLNHPSFFVRRSYYVGHPFDTGLRVSADHKWTLQAYLQDPRQFLYLPIPITTFAAGGASMRVPLKRVLSEGRRVCKDLGMGPWATFLGLTTRTVLYVPQYLKLFFNQHLAPRRTNGA